MFWKLDNFSFKWKLLNETCCLVSFASNILIKSALTFELSEEVDLFN